MPYELVFGVNHPSFRSFNVPVQVTIEFEIIYQLIPEVDLLTVSFKPLDIGDVNPRILNHQTILEYPVKVDIKGIIHIFEYIVDAKDLLELISAQPCLI